MDADISAHLPELREIVRSAQGEAGVDTFLTTLAESWESLQWDIATHQLQQSQNSRSSETALQQSSQSPLSVPRPVVRGWDAILTTVDDHLASLASMRLSPFFGPFALRAEAWSRKLTELRALTDSWLDVQRLWLHMTSLFGGPSGDIRSQLPHEYRRLCDADADMRSIMGRIAAAPQVLASVALSTSGPLPTPPQQMRGGGHWGTPTRSPQRSKQTHNAALLRSASGARDTPAMSMVPATPVYDAATLISLPSGNLASAVAAVGVALARVQAGLAEFLESQRAAFPRFYFLGDDDLLEVLGSGAAAAGGAAVQRHLQRLYAGVSDVRCLPLESGAGPNGTLPAVKSLVSAEGEELPLLSPVTVPATAPLHEWLSGITAGMQSSLLASVVQCTASLPAAWDAAAPASAADALLEAMQRWTIGAVLLAARVRWTTDVERALDQASSVSGGSGSLSTALSRIEANVSSTLQALTAKHNAQAGLSLKEGVALGLLRRKAEAAIVDLVHRRDVTRALVATVAPHIREQDRSYNPVSAVSHSLRSTSTGSACLSTHDFEWTSRLRAYVSQKPVPHAQDDNPSARLELHMGEAVFTHGLEYLGVGERLVQVGGQALSPARSIRSFSSAPPYLLCIYRHL